MDSIAKIYKLLIESRRNEPSEEELNYSFDYDKPITNKILTQAFDTALERHLSLKNPSDRRQSSRNARNVIKGFIGENKDGEVNLLSTNRKLQKANKTDLTLPDGSGIETVGLTLAPAYKQGKWTTCPNSDSCRKTCLGKTAGGWYQYGGGKEYMEHFKGPGKMAYLKRTHALISNPEEFAIRLNDEINIAKYKAEQNGNQLGVRLNVLSDIHPRIFKALIHAHPDVQFYDYTKNNTDPIAPNHHLTYSSTGVSQPAGYNGLTHSVENEHQNWHQMRRRLNQGSNVAMVFSHRTLIPTKVYDEETGKTYHVISGDEHDFRPVDGRHESGDGYIIGLTNKAKNMSQHTAAKESDGFIVHYDPKIKKVRGVQIKDSQGNPIASNTSVTIPKQSREVFTINNDGEKE